MTNLINTVKKCFKTAGLLSAMLFSVFLITSPLSIAAEKAPGDISSAQVQQSVNINRASVKELVSLKGVGEKKAIAIVQYRSKHGKFKSVEQLTKVKGIGEAIVASNKQYIEL